KVSALAVSAVSSVTHNGATVVRAGDVAAAVHAVIDRHPTLGVDRPNLAVAARLNLSAALGGTGGGAFGLMVASGLISTTIPGLISSAISALGSAAIAGLSSATIAGLSSATIRALRPSGS